MRENPQLLPCIWAARRWLTAVALLCWCHLSQVGSQYLITGVFLEAATWTDGALALTDQMLNRLSTVRITWQVLGQHVRTYLLTHSPTLLALARSLSGVDCRTSPTAWSFRST